MFKRYFKTLKLYLSFGIFDKKKYIFFEILNTFAKLLLLAFPILAAKIIVYVEEKQYELAVYFAFFILALGLFYVALNHIVQLLYNDAITAAREKLQSHLLRKVSRYDENYSLDIPTPFIASAAFGDVTPVTLVLYLIMDIFLSALSVCVAAIILCVVNIYVGLFSCLLLIVAFALLAFNLNRRDHFNTVQLQTHDSIATILNQIVDGNREIRSLNIQNEIRKHFSKHLLAWRYQFLSKNFYNNNAFSIAPFILDFGKVCIYISLSILIISGYSSVALLVLIIGYYSGIATDYERLNVNILNLALSSVATERIATILNYKSKHMTSFGRYDRDRIEGKIEFRSVSFAYESKKVLHQLDFIIRPHSFVAIVGQSASGKSTIFRLLTRLYRAQSGKILLDDVEIADYSSEAYAKNVAMVTQSPFIFNMSIRDNLAMVNPDRAAQLAACRKVGVHDFIVNLRQGYNTPLNSNSNIIPPSKKQLIALARALLSNAEVLLFDEVTANTDSRTADKIIKIMKKLKVDHTVLMITHDPSLMRQADNIIVLDKGRLVGRGSHKVLLRRNKYYRRLQNKNAKL